VDERGLVLRLPYQCASHPEKETMRFDDLADFVKCYNPPIDTNAKETWNATTNPEGKWRKFSYEELKAREQDES